MRPRPMRNEPYMRERNSYPSPPKKPRVDYALYPEPERRPMMKPFPKVPGPRAANPVVIEKKPVLFNASPKDEYPPLPQRMRPVPKQQPKPVPQKEPVKTIEKQVQMKPVQKQPVIPAEKREPIKPVQKQPVRAVEKQQPVKPIQKQPVKNVEKQEPVKPIQKQPVKNVEKQEPVKPIQKQPVKTVQKQEPVKPIQKQAVKTVEKQEPVKPIQKQPVKTVEKQEPVKPIQKQPVKTVEKQEPVKPIQKQPVKTVQKQEPVKPIQKQPVKTIEKQEPIKLIQKQPANPGIQNQESPKAAEKKEAKPVDNANKGLQTPVSKPTAEKSSLDPLMSRALRDELHLIMDQVFQTLPETGQSDAERLVINKFESVVGDDIQNVLGLNVTSRLLNVHNPLYVKLTFSGKPEAGCLKAFIDKYKISAFKRIESPHDTFAARLDAIGDFDRLCETKEVSCGSATVTVTPCYKFLSCPPALDSTYATETEEEDTPDSSPLKQPDPVKSENAAAKTEQKATSKDDTQKVTVKKEIERAKETKTVTPVKNTKTATTPVKVNITIEGESKADSKNDSKEIKLESKTESPKETATKSTNNKETATKTNNKVNQSNVVKSQKEVKNDSNNENTIDESNIDGDEEMTDQDILALMSSGIVLDECSGSEDEGNV